jgi:predicted dehydrogenase
MLAPVDPRPLRIGILGAARIAPMALIRPARQVAGVEVAALAARDPERARRFAARHGVPRVHESYEALLADPELDAVYNPLPNSHHCEWTIRALEAGKHVLCEKPLAANAEEAARMGAAAERAGRVLMEAFHWRYHPLAARMREIVGSGELGAVRHVEARFCVPLLLPGDIRYRLDLAGGAAMDAGCYAVHVVRTLAGAEPEVVRAEARLASPRVDRWMAAELRFPGGCSGRVECSLASAKLLAASARVVGEAGELRVVNPIAPQIWHRLSVRGAAGRRSERVPGDASYTHQLRAFRAAVRDGAAFPTHPADSLANMRVIDAIYEAAGLGRRGRS